MPSLNRSWIKPGLYPVHSIQNLKVENTQEFQDKLYDLRSGVTGALKSVIARWQALTEELCGLWSGVGDVPPAWTQRPMTSWTDDDVAELKQCIAQASSIDGEEEMSKLRHLLQKQILADQALYQMQVLNRQASFLKTEPADAVKNQKGIFDLIADTQDGDFPQVSDDYQKEQGFDRLKVLSRSLRDRVNRIVSQRVNRQRLVRIDLEKEVVLATTTVKHESKPVTVKKRKNTSGGADTGLEL